MTTGDGDPEARAGVRANALSAAAFTRLRVVDARVSDALLDVLEDAGVAAYVEPSVGEVGAYRDIRAHAAPSDQLYVDAAGRDTAVAVIAAELPGMLAELEAQPADDDSAFAAIVAGFADPGPHDPADWPEAERSTQSSTDSAEHDDEWYAARAAAPVDDEDEHFVPPPPPPLPRLSGAKLWGVVLLVGGFLLMGGLPLLGFASDDAIIIGVIVTSVGAA
ncbi:MAG: hypothetical protein QOG49_189, partial [Frankiaceae bacterium]|nr:hypothetical protein [Frankiaceae bacterium]